MNPIQNVRPEDQCILCQDRTATVLYKNCHHRMICRRCHDSYVQRRTNQNLPTLCQYCDTPFQNADLEVGECNVQLNQVCLENAEPENGFYPFGFSRNEEDYPATMELVASVKFKYETCRGRINSSEDLGRFMDDELSGNERRIFYQLKTYNDVDLHGITWPKSTYDRLCEDATDMQDIAGRAVVELFSGKSKWAMSYRAAAAGVADGALYAISVGTRSMMGADMASNLLVFVLLTGVDVYSYYSGDPNMTAEVFRSNLKENSSGCVAGLTGGVIGAFVGTLVCPGLGTIIGSILMGMLFDFTGRATYRYLSPKSEQYKLQAEANAILRENAAILRINVNTDSFRRAKEEFHLRIRQVHIDKNRTANEEEEKRLHEECVKLLSAWSVVRKYYEDNGSIPTDEPEGFVDIWCHYVRTNVDEVWNHARTWFSTRSESTQDDNDDFNEYRVVRIHC